MKSTEILACPQCKGPLSLSGEKDSWPSIGIFSCRDCNLEFSSGEGYPDFLGDAGLVIGSKREKIIRSVYAKIYTPATNFMFLFCGGVVNARNEVLSKLEIRDNSRVLETGMGAGENLDWISKKASCLKLYAIDIQKQMMVHCMRNLKKWNLDAEIFRADAEELPFTDNCFDIVFHLGAINLFANKEKAIHEMIRVAKGGTRIVIADETDKAGRLFNLFTGSKEKIEPPLDLIPSDMLDINYEVIWKGYGYVITFSKPAE